MSALFYDTITKHNYATMLYTYKHSIIIWRRHHQQHQHCHCNHHHHHYY